MKVRTLIFLMIVGIVSISGCADSNTEDEAGTQVPQPEAAALFSAFTGDNDYIEWSIWPGEEAMMKGTGVHGDYVTIYVSDNAMSAAQTGGALMPYGTMVVKEGFNSNEELTGIYLMYKAEGFDPEHNDWFWASYTPEGDVRSEGKVRGCIGCHEGKKDVDYIFVNV